MFGLSILFYDKGIPMNIDFSGFDESAVTILKELAKHFPKAIEIGFNDLFPEFEDDNEKRSAHIGVLALLRYEKYIAHEIGSSSSFIITKAGLMLFDQDVSERLKGMLND